MTCAWDLQLLFSLNVCNNLVFAYLASRTIELPRCVPQAKKSCKPVRRYQYACTSLLLSLSFLPHHHAHSVELACTSHAEDFSTIRLMRCAGSCHRFKPIDAMIITLKTRFVDLKSRAMNIK